MNPSDPYRDWDAAYVLGALDVRQRHEYEDHLTGCPDCRSAVSELAGIPGLLAHLKAAEAIALGDRDPGQDAEPVPDSIRTFTPPPRNRVRTRMVLVAAAVLALLVGGIGGFLVHGAVRSNRPNDGSSVLLTFTAQQPTGLVATVRLTPDGARTRVFMDCTYSPHGSGDQRDDDLALQMVDDNGRTVRLWEWWAGPGDHTTWGPKSAPFSLDSIAALQIVDADSGSVVMSAPT